MPEVCIRELVFSQDYAAAVELWRSMEKGVRLGRSDTSEEIQKKLQRDPELFLVAEVGDQVIGTVIGGFDGRRGLIYHLAVHGAYRGQGIGGRLMNEVERRLRLKGCRRCYLMVTPDNAEAMQYYQHRGWAPMDVHGYGKELEA